MRMIVVAGLAFAFGWLWGAAWLLDKLDAARGALRLAQEDVKRLQQRALLKFPMPLHAGDQARIKQANFCPVEK